MGRDGRSALGGSAGVGIGASREGSLQMEEVKGLVRVVFRAQC